jgi:uncharacterized membrane protein (UPF0136 family)
MSQPFKLSVIGSLLAFLVSTSCCWLPILAALGFGGAVGATSFFAKMEHLSGLFMAIGASLAVFAGWKYLQSKKTRPTPFILETVITCPNCQYQKTETMPTDACQYFYECGHCHKILKPKKGDCCVFCSFATVQCPPMQAGDPGCCA